MDCLNIPSPSPFPKINYGSKNNSQHYDLTAATIFRLICKKRDKQNNRVYGQDAGFSLKRKNFNSSLVIDNRIIEASGKTKWFKFKPYLQIF
jgi:hypothetical protein